MSTKINNLTDIEKELIWLTKVLDFCFKTYFDYDEASEDQTVETPSTPTTSLQVKPIFLNPPEFNNSTSAYAQLIKTHQLDTNARLAMAMALAPYLSPSLLDGFFVKNRIYDRKFSEFGGLTPSQYTGFFPTGETLAFVLAGSSVKNRTKVYALFDPEHHLSKYHLLYLGTTAQGEPPLSGSLQPGITLLQAIGANIHQPTATSAFPAQRLTSQQTWEDLVINDYLAKELEDIMQWQIHKNILYQDWGMAAKLRPGYRVLFYGPPGTGKTMTAALLGKKLKKDVYRIDLSAISSKYIGETEKNLAQIFNQAEHQNWILFFDEADALFGKRSQVKDAHDRYANQEVAYLLQRLETFDGLVILATNLKDNIDTAFMRRFEQTLYFAEPAKEQRKQLWEQTKPKQLNWADEVDINQIAANYPMTGGMIINAISYCCLQVVSQHRDKTISPVINKPTIMEAISREFHKVGRTI